MPGRAAAAAGLYPRIGPSRRVVKDHADRVAVPGPYAAHAMPQVHAIDPSGAAHWTVPDGEDHPIASVERHHLDPRLHPRPLLGQDELAAREVSSGLRQEERHLEGEDLLAIEILVQTVVVARAILEQ